jgi:hypothetical protein
MSDRATTVFSGSRASADQRLSANAMIASGLWRDGTAPQPTHLIASEDEIAMRYCGERLYQDSSYTLCVFETAEVPAGIGLAQTDDVAPSRLDLVSFEESGNEPYYVACEPTPIVRSGRLILERAGPWSARRPGLTCRVTVGREQRSGRAVARTLTLEAFVGQAVEQLIVQVRGSDDLGQRYNLRTIVSTDRPLTFRIPRSHVHTIEVRIVPVNLPFVKLAQFEIGFENEIVPSTGGSPWEPR